MRSLDDQSRVGTIESLRDGVFVVLEGARFLRRERRLWPLALVPVTFALVCVATSASLFWIRMDWVHALWADLLPVVELGEWWSWAWVGPARLALWLIGWAAVLVSFAISLIAGLLVANLASAPFLDHLSQRVESIVLGDRQGSVAKGLGRTLVEAVKSFGAELQRLLFLASIWVVLSVLGFVIPGAQLVAGPALVLVTILFLPLDYAGFALDRRGLSFAMRRRWLSTNRSLMIGFGSVAFVACLIPGVNLLILPVQITAATLLVVRRAPSP